MVPQYLRPAFLSLTAVFLGLLALFVARPAAAQGYIVVDLGSLGSGYDDVATGINNQGQVVGNSYLPDNTTYHPFIWDPVHGMQDLGVLPGFQAGFAISINAFGQVVGDCDTYPFTNQRGFLWDRVHGMQDLGTAGTDDSGCEGINDAGQISGYYLPGGVDHAILHSGSGPLSAADDLGLLPGGTESWSFRLNNAGQVAGTADTASGEQHVIVWDGFSGIHDLGTLPGGTFAWAEDINDSGDVAGLSDTASGPYRAFIYSGGEMTDLGTLPGYPHSFGFGIDPSGTQVVGIATLNGFPFYPNVNPMHGFLWRDGLMYDLNSLIAPGSGWIVEFAARINDHSQITGTGYNGSRHDAILLNPIVLSSLTVTPSTIVGCKNATGKVTLSAPAVVDAYVELASQNPAASVPASVKIAAGKSSATFPIKTTAVTAPVTGQITGFDGVLQNATLTVRPIGVKSITLSPTSVVGGNSVIGTVTLECPAAPGSITVTLSSSNSAIANPAVSSITIPAGSQAGTYTVNTSPVSASTGVTMKAIANGISKSGKLTVTP